MLYLNRNADRPLDKRGLYAIHQNVTAMFTAYYLGTNTTGQMSVYAEILEDSVPPSTQKSFVDTGNCLAHHPSIALEPLAMAFNHCGMRFANAAKRMKNDNMARPLRRHATTCLEWATAFTRPGDYQEKRIAALSETASAIYASRPDAPQEKRVQEAEMMIMHLTLPDHSYASPEQVAWSQSQNVSDRIEIWRRYYAPLNRTAQSFSLRQKFA
jgi:hypothetical protein